jgi:hypothetical protein
VIKDRLRTSGATERLIRQQPNERICLSLEGTRTRRSPRGNFSLERLRYERQGLAIESYRKLLLQRVAQEAATAENSDEIAAAVASVEQELAEVHIVSDQEEIDEALAADRPSTVCYVPAGEQVTLRRSADDKPVFAIGEGELVVEFVGEPSLRTNFYIGGSLKARVRGKARLIVEDNADAMLDGASAWGEGHAHIEACNCAAVNLSHFSTAKVASVARLYLNDESSAEVEGVVTEEIMADDCCRLVINGEEVICSIWLKANADGELIPFDPRRP